MKLADRLAALEQVAIPVWVFDSTTLTMVWANARGIELWGAADLAELTARDFKDVTAARRTQLRAQQEAIEAGETFERQFTFYPHGVPLTMQCHISGIALDDGRVAMLMQALDTRASVDPELVRGIEAIRHIWAIVSLVDTSGAVLMQNPAGARAFGVGGTLDGWFVDATAVGAIQREVSEGRVFRGELLSRTAQGERWHAVEAHRTLDPVTGSASTLLLQLDVTETREGRERIAQQEEQIRALSAPILDVGESVLALPLIGVLSEARTREIAGRLLPEVTARRAGSVILDLTGVEALDAAGAEALMKVVRAIELLGARPIVTGIGPRLSEVLVGRGVNLGRTLTLRTLADGLAASRRG